MSYKILTIQHITALSFFASMIWIALAGVDIPPGTLNSILKQAGLKEESDAVPRDH